MILFLAVQVNCLLLLDGNPLVKTSVTLFNPSLAIFQLGPLSGVKVSSSNLGMEDLTLHVRLKSTPVLFSLRTVELELPSLK